MGIPYSGRSTLVVYILPKDRKRVRFPSPAPKIDSKADNG